MNDIDRALTSARNLLVTYGWIRRQYGTRDSGFCLAGAVKELTRGNGRLFAEVMEAVACGLPHDFCPGYLNAHARVFEWNDMLCDGLDSALAVLDRALEARAFARSMEAVFA